MREWTCDLRYSSHSQNDSTRWLFGRYNSLAPAKRFRSANYYHNTRVRNIKHMTHYINQCALFMRELHHHHGSARRASCRRLWQLDVSTVTTTSIGRPKSEQWREGARPISYSYVKIGNNEMTTPNAKNHRVDDLHRSFVVDFYFQYNYYTYKCIIRTRFMFDKINK